MEELREVGVKGSFRRKLARSWLMWTERKEGERLTKRADALRVEGRRRIRRPRLRWEDCVKRDLVGVENESKGSPYPLLSFSTKEGRWVVISETGPITEGKQELMTSIDAIPGLQERIATKTCHIHKNVCHFI